MGEALSVAFRTFGCKLNQAETEAVADGFVRAGARAAGRGEAADIVVFNTCTVTTKAEQKARREMRQALRHNPEAVALVTGCYAELEPDALASVVPRCVVVPGSRKSMLLGLAEGLVSARLEGLDLLDEARRLVALAMGQSPEPFAFFPSDARFHARVQLKVQDGCDNRCAYCRVCLARGRSVGLEPDEAVRRASLLEASGVPELVLTGVNLSQYRSGGLDFPGLLRRLVGSTERVAFRLSSYEPDRVDEAFLSAFSLPRVRPHLHLALQSGSDAILASMGRRYGRDDALRAVDAARAVKDDPFIGADLIVGFPGETDRDFEHTLELLGRIDPAWVHVFTYSPRPGTRAASLRPFVPERVAVERARVVQGLAVRGKAAFAARRLGAELEAVLEGPPEVGGAPLQATSAEYLRLAISGAPPGARGACRCRVTGLEARAFPNPASRDDDEAAISGIDALAEFIEPLP